MVYHVDIRFARLLSHGVVILINIFYLSVVFYYNKLVMCVNI